MSEPNQHGAIVNRARRPFESTTQLGHVIPLPMLSKPLDRTVGGNAKPAKHQQPKDGSAGPAEQCVDDSPACDRGDRETGEDSLWSVLQSLASMMTIYRWAP